MVFLGVGSYICIVKCGNTQSREFNDDCKFYIGTGYLVEIFKVEQWDISNVIYVDFRMK